MLRSYLNMDGLHLEIAYRNFLTNQLLREEVMDISKYINETFLLIESKLLEKLKEQNFSLSSSKISEDDFGSRYSIWKNYAELIAIRFVWDGKESWFLIEESPFTLNNEPNSWADIILVPFKRTNVDESYQEQLIDEILSAIE